MTSASLAEVGCGGVSFSFLFLVSAPRWHDLFGSQMLAAAAAASQWHTILFIYLCFRS